MRNLSSSVHDNTEESDLYEIKSFTIRISENPEGKDASSPEKARDLAKEILKHEDQEKEHFYILILDGKNRLKCAKHISTGTMTSSLVHPREVFRPALMAGGASLICIHNHPSGDPTPSQEDMEITDRLKEVGELVGIHVVDHVIISQFDNEYRSFDEMGLI